jgi:RNA polymerase sigma factor (sigma-70 family)
MPNHVYTTNEEKAIFQAFVKRSYWKLRQYALSLLPASATDTADDLVQEAYVRVLEYIRRGTPMPVSYDAETPDMMRYMRVVIKRLFLDIVLSNRSNEQSLDDQSGASDQILSLHDPDEYANVEKTVLRQESSAEFHAYVDRLPRRMQSMVKLQLDGFSPQEIADALSVTPAAVRVAVMRSRRLLREIIVKVPQTSVVQNQLKESNSHHLSPVIISAVAQLPDPYRIVVGLHLLRQMSYSNIAKTLNKPVGTVKSLCFRGKKLLQMQDRSSAPLHPARQAAVDATLSALLVNGHLLADHLRQVLELHYLQQLSYAQIAKQLGRSEGTIKGWVNRGKTILLHDTQAQSMPKSGASPTDRRSRWTQHELAYMKCMPSVFGNMMQSFYIEHLTLSQIATQQNISKATVKSTLKRGRQYVKEHADSWHHTLQQPSAS